MITGYLALQQRALNQGDGQFITGQAGEAGEESDWVAWSAKVLGYASVGAFVYWLIWARWRMSEVHARRADLAARQKKDLADLTAEVADLRDRLGSIRELVGARR